MKEKTLTAKQRRFVEAYDGNATAAARAAGYKGNDVTLASVGAENLRKPLVAAAIAAREKLKVSSLIANREARQMFWTRVMLGLEKTVDFDAPLDGAAAELVKPKMADRLKASELLAKSEGDFIDKVQVDVGPTLEQLVAESLPPKPKETP